MSQTGRGFQAFARLLSETGDHFDSYFAPSHHIILGLPRRWKIVTWIFHIVTIDFETLQNFRNCKFLSIIHLIDVNSKFCITAWISRVWEWLYLKVSVTVCFDSLVFFFSLFRFFFFFLDLVPFFSLSLCQLRRPRNVGTFLWDLAYLQLQNKFANLT